jgi:HEPN domain-containing protein
MSDQRLLPNDPQEWLNRARSNLSQAKGGLALDDVYLEDLCFQAQQGAEKALKAVLIVLHVRFPYSHDLATLVSLIEKAGHAVPERIQLAATLSDYAVEARYPGVAEPVVYEEYERAIATAEEVIQWAEVFVVSQGSAKETSDADEPEQADDTDQAPL